MRTIIIFVVAILIGLGVMSQSKNTKQMKPPIRPIKPISYDFSKLKDTTNPVKKLEKTSKYVYYVFEDTITNRRDTVEFIKNNY
jgi:hypothetical protein